jgi:hypothetical protein
MELKELSDILDKASDPEAEFDAIRMAIQALQFHQIVYDDDKSGITLAALQAMKDHRFFLEKYFSVAGLKMIFDSKSQMTGLVPEDSNQTPYGWKSVRLKKDQTLMRLVIRHLFESGFRNGTMTEAGRVEATTLEIAETYERLSKGESPSQKLIIENHLRELARKGCVRIGDTDKESGMTRLTILAGIRIIVSDDFMSRLNEWIDSAQSEAFLNKQISIEQAEPQNAE